MRYLLVLICTFLSLLTSFCTVQATWEIVYNDTYLYINQSISVDQYKIKLVEITVTEAYSAAYFQVLKADKVLDGFYAKSSQTINYNNELNFTIREVGPHITFLRISRYQKPSLSTSNPSVSVRRGGYNLSLNINNNGKGDALRVSVLIPFITPNLSITPKSTSIENIKASESKAFQFTTSGGAGDYKGSVRMSYYDDVDRSYVTEKNISFTLKPDINIALSSDKDQISLGDTVRITIKIKNIGSHYFSNIVLTEEVPKEASIIFGKTPVQNWTLNPNENWSAQYLVQINQEAVNYPLITYVEFQDELDNFFLINKTLIILPRAPLPPPAPTVPTPTPLPSPIPLPTPVLVLNLSEKADYEVKTALSFRVAAELEIERAKKIGANTTEGEAILKEANTKLDRIYSVSKRMYNYTIDQSKKVQAMYTTVLNITQNAERFIASEKIRSLNQTIFELKKSGFDTSEFEITLLKAQESYSAKNYINAAQLTSEPLKVAEDLKRKYNSWLYSFIISLVAIVFGSSILLRFYRRRVGL